jgi:hypothetical protein
MLSNDGTTHFDGDIGAPDGCRVVSDPSEEVKVLGRVRNGRSGQVVCF